jgi:hypothetical protein
MNGDRKKSSVRRKVMALTASPHAAVTISRRSPTTKAFVVLDKAGSAKPDWLEKIGFRKILRRYRDPQHITGRDSRCAFALYRRNARPWVAEGLLQFDGQGMNSFLLFTEPVALQNDEVSLSRDGCYALIQMFDQIPDIPQFTLPQQARLLRVVSKQCR